MIENAKIENLFLGIEDHGIMTFSLKLTGDGWGQGFGGYVIDAYDKATKERYGIGEGITAIRKILEVVGVTNWSDLKGKVVRIETDKEGFNRQIIKIGHIVENKWFNIQEHFSKFA